jgi:hypothetical protein
MSNGILGTTLENPDYKSTPDAAARTLGGGNRKYQLDILHQCETSSFNMLVKPSGSGKSFEQAALAIRDAEKGRKQIILVPQVHIADGFFPEDENGVMSFRIHGGKNDKKYRAAVLPAYNFCKKSSVQGLKAWLLAPAASLEQPTPDNMAGGLIAMTSYYAFARAFKHMSDLEKETALTNLHVRADESHHVAMGEQESDYDRNKVGSILKLLMDNHQHNGSGITLSTATNFRSDNKCIVRPEMLSKFKRYRLSFLDHFKNTGIKTFRVEIVPDIKTNPIDSVVKHVCAKGEGDKYHIIVVPPSNAGWRALRDDPSHGLTELITKVKEQWLKTNGKECRLLNLVVPHTLQKKRKAALIAEPKVYNEDRMPAFDVVVTCMLGREGTDWCPASRLHVTYVEGSVTLAVQTLGRILRRFGKKDEIVARYYYPKFPEPDEEGMTASELLNSRKNALLFMTEVDDLFFPIALEEVDQKAPSNEQQVTVTLRDMLGETQYIQMKRAFLKQAVDDVLGTLSTDGLELIMDEVLKEYVPPKHWAQARRVLWGVYMRRANIKFQSVNVDFMGEDLDIPTLIEELTLDQKTLVCHGGDHKVIEKMNIIAKTSFQEKVELLKSYNLKMPADIKKLPLELRVFANQLCRRRRDTLKALGVGVS